MFDGVGRNRDVFLKDFGIICIVLAAIISMYSLGIYQGYSDGLSDGTNSCEKR